MNILFIIHSLINNLEWKNIFKNSIVFNILEMELLFYNMIFESFQY